MIESFREPMRREALRWRGAGRRLKLFLIALIVLLGLAALAVPVIMRRVDQALVITQRHEIAWTAQNGLSELGEAFRQITMLDGAFAADRLGSARLAVDIVFSRMETWSSGQLGAFIGETAERRRSFANLRAGLAELDAPGVDLSQPHGRTAALRILAAMAPDVAIIAAEAYIRHIQNNADNAATLRFYQRLQTAIVGVLILCGLLLIYLLSRQNRHLVESHGRQLKVAAENAFLAAHDPLTSLPNRNVFLGALKSACEGVGPRRAVAVVAVDLDGFKPINDVLGHKTGDHLLVTIGQRLQALVAMAEGGMVARFGGDEFLLKLEGVDAPEAAEALAERVREELCRPAIVDNHHVTIGATVGFSVSDDPTMSPEELIHQADIALNVGKACGKGVVRMFHAAMMEGSALRRQLEQELADADLDREIEAYFQPVVALDSGKIVGVEALARWCHPRRGFVTPSDFIPVAESSGRIIEIGEVVLRKACEEACRWPEPIFVAVNLSAVQLMRIDVTELVWTTLAKTGLPANRLKLEVTESVMIHDARGIRRLMNELQDMGVTVALDDFGTGFSSLSYLRDFPFDQLKIDRSFVADIEHDRQAASIVQAIVGLSHALNMDIVVEGIETENQARFLQAMGCAHGQGWHFGKPLPPAELRERLRRNACQSQPAPAQVRAA